MFYLEIPSAIVATVCLHPLKYLQYLGWCVLGIIGDVRDEQGNAISLDGELVDQGVYHYIVSNQDVLAHAVDLEVIKQRSQVSSDSTEIPEDFSAKLLERDGRCVLTGARGIGMHIIPYERGDEWLQLIVDNRPHDENLGSLTIDDIRNGIYADNNLHYHHFNSREVIILKTPNPILETTDVPDRHQRDIPADVSYPAGSRYTFQWLVKPEQVILNIFPNNTDATFKNQKLAKPADVLLHYNYGAAAVKQWGRNASVLTNRPGVPRPSVLPIRVKDGRNIAQKWATALSKRKCGDDEPADSEVEDAWDEDDVVSFFWTNTKEARERRAREDQEHTAYLEDWRAAVTGIPDVV